MKSIILAGGSGTRLFPLSRKKFPKQFLSFGDDETLLQKTIKRNLKAVNDINELIIITNNDYQFHVKNQISDIIELSEKELHIILEPIGRNTAPAIALAVKYALDKLGSSEDEVLFISPSDHIISPDDKFVEYVKKAEELAKKGHIVTFGINPVKPETGYGYIEADTQNKIDTAYKVRQFHEKPDLETAQKYIMSGNYYWNSGMFAFSIKTILEEFRKHIPEIYNQIENQTFEEVIMNFEDMPDISIDYAVMEKTDKAVVLPLDITWSDVGSWDSVYDVLEKDESQNVKIGNILDVNTKGSLIFGNKRLISTIGLEDLIIVETDDVLLIAKKGEGQKVKEIVNKLKESEETKDLTEFHTTVFRPWGSYTELEKGERYKIKRITVKPGEALSLQMHHHRSEHWVVVKGTAKVILEDKEGNLKEYFIHENESIYVPKSTRHRLINPGKIPLEIIEVQVGEYVEEDDIVRYDDKYKRNLK
ncbi:MAG TPA: mannose-1-phosphate guanylyltransferase/mannose-6-phosphate isomerase [Persephonella sp.]|uniref:mannose-1-phosphate guanylyltransferase n=1 Tax=Persephonella marina (strain DSM 14350 / EX-H1) TaxID=123214 RepID=C0QSW1_PERMH|nr:MULTISPECIES: mannose-1-phosphate guanylyltransferase/mannose-6-phosphate isomerase [Persephonella]ACO03811.1 mannose-1-phosphate guanylyltransferase/mannose-6-phosphate isomerase [Persephonella marina EX-H1]HCB70604.1 mannose-1-phosphate guanylyltransferase/mannose-6-phosphate isomerase [Persephonella sp.]